MVEEVRLDQWLWAARFYKTRALAVTAIKNGRVLVNRERCKPARKVQIGDIIDIQKTPEIRYEIEVLILENKRAGAKLAQTYYKETDFGYARRIELQNQQKIARDMVSFPSKRPEKHDRQRLRNIRHHYSDDA